MLKTYRIANINFKKRFELLLLLAVLVLGATSAQAVLFRVGPNDVPSPPGNGYPLWYQDTAGLALDLCLPKNAAQLNAGVCLILPPDQDPVAGLNLPIVFPTNYPDEAFWWNGTAVMDIDANNRAVLVLGLEAAFGGGAVAVGDQVTFGRIRVVVDAPVDGTYTVTHPYGVKVFPDVVAGRRAITFTDDIGIGAPGDFTGALKSGVGPFLQAAELPGGPPRPYFTVPGDDSGDQFLADTAAPVFVTGSPVDDPQNPGQKANFFRICVDAAGGLDGAGTACLTLDQFTLMGKVHTAAIGSPLTLDRTTYSRNATGAHVDVFATAKPGPGAPPPRLFFGDAAGTNLMPSTLMNGPTALFGQFYGQSIPPAAAAIPASVIVTNIADNPPSSIAQSLVDEVTITAASYDPANGSITITATSSDKGIGTIVPPQLSALGLPGSVTGSDPLLPVGGADPAEQRLVYAIPAPLPPGGPVPPFAITVISTAGGQDTESTSTLAGGSFAAGGPVAVDDVVLVEASATLVSVPVPVLTNDFGYDPATVRIVSQGKNGTASVVDAAGTVIYTFINPLLVGDDTFTYTVRNAAGLESNVAFAVVTTTAPAGGPAPIAVGDGPFSVQVNAALTIPAATLLANDSGNGGILDPASILIASVTGGTATVAANGDVTYNAGGVPGNFNFTYTVASTTGQRSAPATVSITVLPANAAITITAAQFRTGTRRWDVSGTSTVNGSTVTVRLVRTGAIVGTAPVIGGLWTFRVQPSTVIAVNGDVVSATSTAGGNASLAVRVRQ